MVVFKFGGKSLSGEDKAYKICEYIKSISQTTKVVVVVSAVGDTTDKLIELANKYCTKNINQRELDVLLSTGETQSAALLSIMLNNMGVKTISLQAWQIDLKAMGQHGKSIITGINASKLLNYFETFDVAVITGFQGVNHIGDITTLGRGGSDTTAVALGAVLNCQVEIYSDFAGVFAGDPKMCKFKKFDQVDYDFMQRISNSGAKVLSPSSVDIAKQANIKLICKQASNPQESGTHINNVPKPLVSVVCSSNLCKIDILTNSFEKDMQKTAKYIINNVKYHEILIKNNQISVILEQDYKDVLIENVSKLNNLMEDNNV